MPRTLSPDAKSGFCDVVGIGGIGTGVAFELEGDHTLGREESRLGALLAGRDYCKLHIVEHYIATLMGAGSASFRVAAIGVVGDDPAGRQLLQEMQTARIETQWVRKDQDRSTLFSACFVYPDRSGGNITASNSAAATLNERDLKQAEERMRSGAGRCIALCLPEVPLDIRHKFLIMATENGNFRAASFTLAEIAPARELGLFSMIDLVALNQEEASALAGYPYTAEDTAGFLARCSAALTAVRPGMRIVISAGGQGAYGFENGVWSFCPAPKVKVVSTGGAGDALLAGVLSGLAAGLSLVHVSRGATALELGVMFASLSVTTPDAIHFAANLEELERFASSRGFSLGN
jgi:sugar/nucleoside kinase (ribokinase family)